MAEIIEQGELNIAGTIIAGNNNEVL